MNWSSFVFTNPIRGCKQSFSWSFMWNVGVDEMFFCMCWWIYRAICRNRIVPLIMILPKWSPQSLALDCWWSQSWTGTFRFPTQPPSLILKSPCLRAKLNMNQWVHGCRKNHSFDEFWIVNSNHIKSHFLLLQSPFLLVNSAHFCTQLPAVVGTALLLLPGWARWESKRLQALSNMKRFLDDRW